jgi:hypothetical protein
MITKNEYYLYRKYKKKYIDLKGGSEPLKNEITETELRQLDPTVQEQYVFLGTIRTGNGLAHQLQQTNMYALRTYLEEKKRIEQQQLDDKINQIIELSLIHDINALDFALLPIEVQREFQFVRKGRLSGDGREERVVDFYRRKSIDRHQQEQMQRNLDLNLARIRKTSSIDQIADEDYRQLPQEEKIYFEWYSPGYYKRSVLVERERTEKSRKEREEKQLLKERTAIIELSEITQEQYNKLNQKQQNMFKMRDGSQNYIKKSTEDIKREQEEKDMESLRVAISTLNHISVFTYNLLDEERKELFEEDEKKGGYKRS